MSSSCPCRWRWDTSAIQTELIVSPSNCSILWMPALPSASSCPCLSHYPNVGSEVWAQTSHGCGSGPKALWVSTTTHRLPRPNIWVSLCYSGYWSIGFMITSLQLSESCCPEQHKHKGRKTHTLCTGSRVTAPPSASVLHQLALTYLHDLLLLATLCHDFGTADAEIGFCDPNRLRAF